jgi:hypothetical protein
LSRPATLLATSRHCWWHWFWAGEVAAADGWLTLAPHETELRPSVVSAATSAQRVRRPAACPELCPEMCPGKCGGMSATVSAGPGRRAEFTGLGARTVRNQRRRPGLGLSSSVCSCSHRQVRTLSGLQVARGVCVSLVQQICQQR